MKSGENYPSVRSYFRGLIFATVLANPATQSATIVDKQNDLITLENPNL